MSNAAEENVVAGFTEEQAHRLSRVSLRQLRSWAKDGFFTPSLDLTEAGFPGRRLYTFRDLACLRVINTLRNESKVPLQRLRSVKTKLHHLGEDMWAKTTLYVLNRRVQIHNPDTGAPEEVMTGQAVLQIPLVAVSNDMRGAIRELRARPAETYGQINTKIGGKKDPVIAGTRIPVRTIKAFSDQGYTVPEITQQYPSLTREDVEAALRYHVAA